MDTARFFCMSILIPFLVVVHVLICALMVFVVLMQRPRSEGLGAAFGGGVADNIFGAQTTHVLQKFTVYLGGGFFLVTLFLAILFAKAAAGPTKLEEKLLEGVPAAETAPAATTPESVPSADHQTAEPAAPAEPAAQQTTAEPAAPEAPAAPAAPVEVESSSPVPATAP